MFAVHTANDSVCRFLFEYFKNVQCPTHAQIISIWELKDNLSYCLLTTIYIFLKQCVSAIQGQGGALGLSFEIRQCVWSEGIVIRWCGRFDDRQHVSCGTPCIGGLFLESVDPFSGCRPNRKVSFNQVFLRGDPVWLHLSTMSRKQVFLLLCDLL